MKKLSKEAEKEDPRLIPLVKKKTFLNYEKNYLYNTLLSESQDKKDLDRYENNIKKYIVELIKSYIYPEGLDEFSEKISESIYYKLSSVRISYIDLGLCDSSGYYYEEEDGEKQHLGNCRNFSLEEYNLFNVNYLNPALQSSKQDRILRNIHKVLTDKGCSKAKLVTLANMVEDYLICAGRYNSFLKPYKNNKWSGPRAFENIKTWGALYKENKDWFDIVYEKFKEDLEKNKGGEVITVEMKIKQLESCLEL